MTNKNDDIENTRRNKPLHASVRFVVALILQLWMLYYFTHEGAMSGGDADDKRKQFLGAFVPTIAILFLLPVIIRGSRSQKLIAIILLLLPVWMAFNGWMNLF